ncbi:zinc finger protein OZF-like isoform X3 [Acanthopagrus latus]|uniref:zinc finger protein OZF-like isoform X3 n=1 Tax=Acanthopagrus latus TaxID=8177 RepID=UPI00187D0872|nr:zinc finger protein OZF-like isoform X3 [Acanthopagrus latus]
MSSVECLRGFISERLTAAAEEIFGVFQKTIVKYEEEIDRQRKLLDVRKPEIKFYRIELPQQVLTDQLLCKQERSSSLDQEEPEPPQIKEEQEELRCSQEGEQRVCTEDEVLTDQLLCNQERNSSLDQEEPEPPQIKEEQEGEQLVLKQETDTSMLIPPYEESDHSDHQLLSDNSDVAESQSQKGGKHGDSGSTRAAKQKTKKRHGVRNSQRLFKCDTCGRDFTRKSALNAHLTIHTGERPFSCNTCGKSFRIRKSLILHMRVHTGEKPFSCKTCGKEFRSSDNLMIHMRVHTGEKPFYCKTCGKDFRCSSNLLSHVKVHTSEKPFSCNTCGKRFRIRKSLILHMSVHTGEKPYLCQTCGKKFSWLSQMKRHIRRH